uniref:Zgc:171501 n=1 Tax=Sinocyclocheilus grahami TaxID=75366 RepID=A0A672R3J6_SINGR
MSLSLLLFLCLHNKVRLRLSRKLCYAVGGVPYQMTNIAMGFSLQIFLLDVVQVLKEAVLSMPLAILAYIFLWFIPHNAVSSAFSVAWYLTISCLFETFMSCYSVPYTSLNMFLGGDQQDRDSATAYSENTSIAFAMLMAAVIQGQVLWVYNKDRDQALCCRPLTLSLGRSIKAPIICNLRLFAYTLTVHIYDCVSHQRSAFMISALVMSALFFVCCMVLFLGVKEQRGAAYSTFFAQIRIHMHTTYLNAVKKLIGHVSYQRLVLGFLFSTLAFQSAPLVLAKIAETFLGSFPDVFGELHTVAGLGAQFQYLMLAILVSATISVPMWQMALVRLGKKTALFIGLPLLIPALVVLVAMPENFPVYMVMCVLAGSSLAALFLLPWSKLSDVVDEFTVQNPSCKGLEPLFFFSCSRFCNKLGGGLSAGISTLTLHLKLLLAPIPIGFLLVGLVLFYLYPINEVRRKQIQQDLGNTR